MNMSMAYNMARRNRKAKGGAVDYFPQAGDSEQTTQDKRDMIDKIMAKRMASGGEVDPFANIKNADAESIAFKKQSASQLAPRKMAEGGYIDDWGMNDQEIDQDHFLAEHDNEDQDLHLTATNEPGDDLDAKQDRKKILAGVMQKLRARHYGMAG